MSDSVRLGVVTSASQPEVHERPLRHLDISAVPGRGPNLRRSLVLLDAAAAALAWALFVGFPAGSAGAATTGRLLAAAGVVVGTAATLLAVATGRLYLARVCAIRAVQAARLARAAALATLAVYLFVELVELPSTYSNLAAGGVSSFFLLLVGRGGYETWVASLRRRGVGVWPVLLVGDNREAANLYRLAREHPERGIAVRGVITTGHRDPALRVLAPIGRLDDVEAALSRSGATGVVIAATALAPDELNDLVRRLSSSGVHMQLSTGLQGIAHHRLRMSPVAHEPLIYLEPPTLPRWQRKAKRAMDIAIAGTALALVAPVLAVTAILIKRSDGGPVFFRQSRVGLHGQVFELLKFRTMVVDAEDRLAELAAHNQRGGPLFKVAHDPRVTKLGRILRATSVDELPQLLNVLGGEMSLVGPRPALPQEARQFSARLSTRVSVLPGITGLWQVEARDNPSFWSYERLDLFYLENWSVWLDLSILFGTFVVVSGRGTRFITDGLLKRESSCRGAPVLD